MTQTETTTSTIEVGRTPGRVVEELYAAFTAGDVDAVADALHDDVVFHVPGRGLNAGTYRGREAVVGFFASAAALTGGTLALQLRDVTVGDAHVVALATYRAEREARTPLENHLAHVMSFRDGRVVESWFHSRDQYAVDAFWS